MSLLSELKFVHNMLRRDLASIRRMAGSAAAGGDLAEVRKGLSHLSTRGPLFQLKDNCLSYCSIVHTHHSIESATLFPRIRRMAPDLNAAVDRLEADHVAVAGLLDEVTAAARDAENRSGWSRRSTSWPTGSWSIWRTRRNRSEPCCRR